MRGNKFRTSWFVYCLLSLVIVGVGCGGEFARSAELIGPRWDLSKPIYVEVVLHDGMNNLPHAAENVAALKTAIQMAGGIVSEVPVDQVIYLDNSDAPPCTSSDTNEVDAWVPLPLDRAVTICHSNAVLSTFTQEQRIAIMLHELGHLFGNRGGHLMDGVSIMNPTATDHVGQSYTWADKEYLCSSGNTIHGVCDDLR